jgi:membrane protein YdbS with pleckstrin-like domain
MTFSDWLRLIHPIMAIVVVYPLIGLVVRYAWQARQRRLEAKTGKSSAGKSPLPPTAGADHVRVGRWLTGAVTGLAMLGLARPIGNNLIKQQVWVTAPGQVMLIVLMFVATIGALIGLYRAKSKGWRATFATLTSMGLVVLGMQPGVFRRTDEWWFSHYYFGISAAILMVVALAILPEIYRHLTWRRVHVALNTIALLLFLGQGITGTRDLLEIPLSWQEATVFGCDFVNRVCGKP